MNKKRSPFLISFVTSILVFFILGLFVYANRGVVFDIFASEYIRKHQASNVLAQDTFVTRAVERANPAVVSIIVTKNIPVLEEYLVPGPFGFLVPEVRERGSAEREVGGGSGFIVSSEGLVVTNKHVVSDEEASFTVLTSSGESYPARVIARDPFFDIAVLKIEDSKTLPFLEFGSSEDIKLGQTVIAIGNALGEFRNSISVGVISGLSRSIVAIGVGGREVLEEVIQTDAAINPGNSGGPLLDLEGYVVGMNVAVATQSENIGFALPSDLVADVVDSVLRTGEIMRPYLGVHYVGLSLRQSDEFDLLPKEGVIIVGNPAVLPGSPAEKAGLMDRDIILEVGGEKIDADTSLSGIIRKRDVGERVEIVILRGGKRETIAVTLERAPQSF